MKIFISHSSTNSEFANDICELLEKNEHSCFVAPRDIRPGYEYAAEILQGIDNSQAILLLLSKEANDSPHVLREIERAVSRKLPILVYKLDEVTLNSSLEYFIMTHQWINTENNDKSAIVTHINNLAATLTTDSSSTDLAENNNNNNNNTDKPNNLSDTNSDKEFNKAIFFPLSIVALVTACILLVNVIGSIWNKETNKENASTSNASTNNTTTSTPTTDNDKEGTTDTSDNDNKDNSADIADVSVGDIITFGKYNDADIEWFVVNVSDNKATLVSRHIISFKGFSAPESGKYNHDGSTDYYGREDPIAGNYELQAYVRGNSSWEASTIRQWLNSDKEIVAYTGTSPEDKVFADFVNGYDTEAGFLHGFSKDERASIVETTIKTNGNILSSKESTTTDKVFLLSKDELSWLTDAGLDIYATVTPQAAKQEESNYYQHYCIGLNTETSRYWLREPVAEDSYICYLVGNSDCLDLVTLSVGVSQAGIRPALTVDLSKNTIKVKE